MQLRPLVPRPPRGLLRILPAERPPYGPAWPDDGDRPGPSCSLAAAARAARAARVFARRLLRSARAVVTWLAEADWVATIGVAPSPTVATLLLAEHAALAAIRLSAATATQPFRSRPVVSVLLGAFRVRNIVHSVRGAIGARKLRARMRHRQDRLARRTSLYRRGICGLSEKSGKRELIPRVARWITGRAKAPAPCPRSKPARTRELALLTTDRKRDLLRRALDVIAAAVLDRDRDLAGAGELGQLDRDVPAGEAAVQPVPLDPAGPPRRSASRRSPRPPRRASGRSCSP